MPADPETSTKQKSFLQFNPRLDVRVRGRIKRERGYDYPELHTEDSAARRLLVRTLLEKQLQIH
jgi:hypothetical protein